MKKTFLILILSILSLSACGTDANNNSNDSKGNENSTSENGNSNSDSGNGSNGTITENYYTVTWKNYNGTVLETDINVKEGTMPHYDGIDPTRPEEGNYAYNWTGWTPELVAVTSNQTYSATYSSIKVVYSIAYILDGGVNSSSNPSSYRVGTSFSFIDASKTGYQFQGWFNQSDNRVTGITSDTTGDLVLTAKWSAVKNTLIITSEDDSKGTVSITSGSGYSNESITVTAAPNTGYTFNGWYNGNTKVSDNSTYTFTMPTNDYSLVAHFIYDEDRAIRLGIKPNLSDDGNNITYGLYPQDNVTNQNLINSLNSLTSAESNGWYLYNDEYYAKISATPYQSGYKFDNGNIIVSGTTYWFKCEPISWRILDNNNGEYYLLSSVLLDAHCYYHSQDIRVINGYNVYPNDYEDSDIRAWLNNDFFNTAFNLDNDNIQVTHVDNSAETTHSPANSYWCNDTEDKVFLPSYQDFMNTSYGFTNDDASTDTRKCKTTDYARAVGVYYYTKINPYYSPYWTRSPFRFYNSIYSAADVDSAGRLAQSDVAFDGDAVRPSIILKIS